MVPQLLPRPRSATHRNGSVLSRRPRVSPARYRWPLTFRNDRLLSAGPRRLPLTEPPTTVYRVSTNGKGAPGLALYGALEVKHLFHAFSTSFFLHSSFFVRVRRETGKKSVVRVHHGEGVAIHIDPESCADAREGIGEALTGERIGQAIEP
jgi:hypothetical protein